MLYVLMAPGRKDLTGPRLKPVVPLGDRTDPATGKGGCRLEAELVRGTSSALFASQTLEGRRVPAGGWNSSCGSMWTQKASTTTGSMG